jgi:pimeloyl-ACP methyl ester carboxylesterase
MNFILKKYKLIILIIIVFAFASYLALNYAIKNVLPYSPIRPIRVTNGLNLAGPNYPGTPSFYGLDYTDFNITVEDTIKLKGWFIYSQSKPARGTVFLLHGISDSKSSKLQMAKMLSDEDFNCVCYDLRANGESGGINCTFGYYEKSDLSKYIDSAIVRFPGSEPYGVFGHSLGAAVAIQTMAVDKRLACGIAASPFSNLRQIIHDYFAEYFLIHLDFIADKSLVYTEKIARFPVDSVQPAASAKMIHQPVMIIHGLADKNISPKYGEEIFNNLSSKDKLWYPVPGGGHNDLPKIGGDEYNKKIVEFYKRYMVK